MKRKYNRRVKRTQDKNRLEVEFGGEVTLMRLALTSEIINTSQKTVTNKN